MIWTAIGPSAGHEKKPGLKACDSLRDCTVNVRVICFLPKEDLFAQGKQYSSLVDKQMPHENNTLLEQEPGKYLQQTISPFELGDQTCCLG